MTGPYDLLVVGGGVNGAGIARDATGRGLSVLLAERDDLAAHTSSASTKLIHGGLRYLEQYEFRLVREALIERETLLKAAPHIIWPLSFVLPHRRGLRPAWLLRLGLLLYDRLGGRGLLERSRSVRLDGGPWADGLKPTFRRGFVYSDCWVEDSRLVVLNAVDASARGARIETYTEVEGLSRGSSGWTASLRRADGTRLTARARAVVNAAGPWVDPVDGLAAPGRNARTTRLVKGSHLVLRRLYDGDHAYIFQQTDGRIVFAIPYEGAFTLVGTTDVAVEAPEDGAEISAAETDYLLAAAAAYFDRRIGREDIVWSYAGVRPLFDDAAADASKVTRDYVLKLNAEGPPILSVYGGKITTYRKLAEAALARLAPFFPGMGDPWTAGAALPGGDFGANGFEDLVDRLAARYPWAARKDLRRLGRAYGDLAFELLADSRETSDLGQAFGAGLTEREARWLTDREFAMTADDILWRRSKLGLHMTPPERQAFAAWMDARGPSVDRRRPAAGGLSA